jgi:hypothetical protein
MIGALCLLAACNSDRPLQGAQEPTPPGAVVADDAVRDTGATQAAATHPLISRAERLQSNLDAILVASTRVTGSWFVGEVSSEFTMYMDGDRETYAEERVKLGNGGTAWRQYFFDDGTLAFFVEEGSRPNGGDVRSGDGGDSVLVVLEFNADGEVESFYKTVGGAPADLGESEGAIVRQNLERLREGARQAGL